MSRFSMWLPGLLAGALWGAEAPGQANMGPSRARKRRRRSGDLSS